MMRLVLVVAYVLTGAFGVASLPALLQAETDVDRWTAVFAGGFFALVGFGGLALVSFILWFGRHRPGPVLGTAPSGAPATFFRRSPFMVVWTVVFGLGLGLWAGALAVVLYGYGHGVWASLSVPFALLSLYPPAVLLGGRVRSGGLWLTPVGLEYRKEAVSWTLAWSDLERVDRTGAGVETGVLPHASGSWVVAVEPLALVLRHGARHEVRRTVRRMMWNRECRVVPGVVSVDCFDVAGGRSPIAEMIEQYLHHPWSRKHLGTGWSLPRRPYS